MDSVTPSYVENVVAEGVPGRSPGGWKVDFSAQKGGVSQAEQTGSRLGADWEQAGSRLGAGWEQEYFGSKTVDFGEKGGWCF